MKVGYGRVSTLDKGQDTINQESRLRADGCQVIFTDTGQSGTKASRPGWNACLAFLQPGDVLVSVRLDRWGRSVQHLLQVANDMNARGIGLRCIDQPFDTTTSMGRLIFGILACVAAFELEILRERTLDGMATARANGKQIGAPKSLTEAQEAKVAKLRAAGMSPKEISEIMDTSLSTVYRVLSRAAEEAVTA